MIPGEIFPAAGDITLNEGRAQITLMVANTGDRPVQVGSHYHFAETNAALICNQAITTVEAFVPRGRLIDNTDTLSVHLLCSDERRVAESMCSSDFAVNAVQPGERFQLIVRHLNTSDAQGESVNDVALRAERRELFSQKLTGVHLLPEVVREECLVSTGFRIPAPSAAKGWFRSRCRPGVGLQLPPRVRFVQLVRIGDLGGG